MHRLHIFNPDTDYALASDSPYYTAPAHVIAIRRKNALLPAVYAETGDSILIMDEISDSIDNLPFHDIAAKKNIRIFTIDDAVDNIDILTSLVPDPWGWNRQIRHRLLEISGGKPFSCMPTEGFISKIRELSHRRTTIEFLKEMSGVLDPEIEIPVEIDSVEKGIAAFRSSKELFFKAPWSSSGRGIILTDDLEEKHVAPWLRGIIRRQGSVMMEKAYKRKLDFATEWICRDGSADFIGYSVFNVSRRGKYRSNEVGTQEKLLGIIRSATDRWHTDIVSRQKLALEKRVAPFYSGPVGIDMLITESGAVNPCVEINLRHTMGMVGLSK